MFKVNEKLRRVNALSVSESENREKFERIWVDNYVWNFQSTKTQSELHEFLA